MTILSNEQLEVLKNIIRELCVGNKAVPGSIIFERFELTAKSGMEEYKFKRELSAILKQDLIPGFEMVMGRNGGVKRDEPMERVTLSWSDGNITTMMKKSILKRFLSELKSKATPSNSNRGTSERKGNLK